MERSLKILDVDTTRYVPGAVHRCHVTVASAWLYCPSHCKAAATKLDLVANCAGMDKLWTVQATQWAKDVNHIKTFGSGPLLNERLDELNELVKATSLGVATLSISVQKCLIQIAHPLSAERCIIGFGYNSLIKWWHLLQLRLNSEN